MHPCLDHCPLALSCLFLCFLQFLYIPNLSSCRSLHLTVPISWTDLSVDICFNKSIPSFWSQFKHYFPRGSFPHFSCTVDDTVLYTLIATQGRRQTSKWYVAVSPVTDMRKLSETGYILAGRIHVINFELLKIFSSFFKG